MLDWESLSELSPSSSYVSLLPNEVRLLPDNKKALSDMSCSVLQGYYHDEQQVPEFVKLIITMTIKGVSWNQFVYMYEKKDKQTAIVRDFAIKRHSETGAQAIIMAGLSHPDGKLDRRRW